ncbi:MAG: helix-turn-helix domain-containing protein [Thermomicrobiales bacterium]
MTTIGQRLRDARERRFMTQEELGKRANVQSVTISRIENDRQASRPRISTIRKLAEALGDDPGWIMFGEVSEDAKSAA